MAWEVAFFLLGSVTAVIHGVSNCMRFILGQGRASQNNVTSFLNMWSTILRYRCSCVRARLAVFKILHFKVSNFPLTSGLPFCWHYGRKLTLGKFA